MVCIALDLSELVLSVCNDLHWFELVCIGLQWFEVVVLVCVCSPTKASAAEAILLDFYRIVPVGKIFARRQPQPQPRYLAQGA